MNLCDQMFHRKMGRRFFAAAAAFCLTAGALAGCKANSGTSESGKNQTQKEGTSETGQEAGGSAKGRFMETEISLPDEVKEMSFLSCFQDENKNYQFYFQDEAKGWHSYRYDGTKWSQNANTLNLPDDFLLRWVFKGHDKKTYAGGFDADYIFHLYSLSEAGQASEVFSDLFKAPEGKDYGLMPDYVGILENGNLLLSTVSQAEVYTPDGQRKASLPQAFIGMDQRMSAYTGPDSYLTMAEKGGLVRYNTETGEEEGSYDLPDKQRDSQGNMTVLEGDDGGIYVAAPSGLYHTVKDGTIWEQIIDGTLNSMNRQDLYIRNFFEGSSGDYYGVYTKTGGDQAIFLHYDYDETMSTVPPETVSVYALRDNRTVRQAAAVLQKNNPRIRVDFRIAVTDEQQEVTEDVIRALNTELLNGKGADVLILDGLPMESYREKGVLADMTDLVNDMKPELLPNVAGGFTAPDGHIYYMPARIKLPVIYGEQSAVDAWLSLDKMMAYDGTVPLFSPDIYENLLRQIAYICHEELFKEDGSVKEGALRKYLEAVKAAGEKSTVKTEYTEAETETLHVNNMVLPDGFGRHDAFDLIQDRCAAAVEILDSIDSAMLPVSAMEQRGYAFQSVNDIYMPSALVGINATAANKEGAEEFVKTLFSGEVQDESLYSGFAVRNDSLDKWAAADKDSMVSIGVQGDDVSLEAGWPSKGRREEIINILRSVSAPVIVDSSIMQMIVDGSKNYLDGKETVEGAVSAIENKIKLYMAERE